MPIWDFILTKTDLLYCLTTLMESSESNARLLSADDKEWQDRTLCSRCEGKISGRRFSKYKPLLIFELCQILVVLFGFGIFALFQRNRGYSGLNQCMYQCSHRSRLPAQPHVFRSGLGKVQYDSVRLWHSQCSRCLNRSGSILEVHYGRYGYFNLFLLVNC